MTEIRIAKFIADSGAASRRRAEELVCTGHVRVNGEKILTPVHFVNPGDIVTLDGRAIEPRTDTKVFAFHKPINTMTTAKDPAGRRTIYHCLPLELRGLKYIGRLDYRTTGLLLLTNDGELARKLTLPESNIPRTYIATVGLSDLNRLDEARQGITVDGIHYRPMDIRVMSTTPYSATLRVTVTEGKKNEVRIVLRAVGAPVRKLHRVIFGPIKLGNLKVGEIRPLDKKSIDALINSF